jgi:ABC-type transport system involved in cytochrome bd biosynthesis fused ATPase/permease subunit
MKEIQKTPDEIPVLKELDTEGVASTTITPTTSEKTEVQRAQAQSTFSLERIQHLFAQYTKEPEQAIQAAAQWFFGNFDLGDTVSVTIASVALFISLTLAIHATYVSDFCTTHRIRKSIQKEAHRLQQRPAQPTNRRQPAQTEKRLVARLVTEARHPTMVITHHRERTPNGIEMHHVRESLI